MESKVNHANKADDGRNAALLGAATIANLGLNAVEALKQAKTRGEMSKISRQLDALVSRKITDADIATLVSSVQSLLQYSKFSALMTSDLVDVGVKALLLGRAPLVNDIRHPLSECYVFRPDQLSMNSIEYVYFFLLILDICNTYGDAPDSIPYDVLWRKYFQNGYTAIEASADDLISFHADDSLNVLGDANYEFFRNGVSYSCQQRSQAYVRVNCTNYPELGSLRFDWTDSNVLLNDTQSFVASLAMSILRGGVNLYTVAYLIGYYARSGAWTTNTTVPDTSFLSKLARDNVPVSLLLSDTFRARYDYAIRLMFGTAVSVRGISWYNGSFRCTKIKFNWSSNDPAQAYTNFRQSINRLAWEFKTLQIQNQSISF